MIQYRYTPRPLTGGISPSEVLTREVLSDRWEHCAERPPEIDTLEAIEITALFRQLILLCLFLERVLERGHHGLGIVVFLPRVDIVEVLSCLFFATAHEKPPGALDEDAQLGEERDGGQSEGDVEWDTECSKIVDIGSICRLRPVRHQRGE
jgi:hypothetical protein